MSSRIERTFCRMLVGPNATLDRIVVNEATYRGGRLRIPRWIGREWVTDDYRLESAVVQCDGVEIRVEAWVADDGRSRIDPREILAKARTRVIPDMLKD